MFRWVGLRGELHGIFIYRNNLVVSYILFVDDNFFFFWVEELECCVVKCILAVYESTSS